MFFCTCGLRRSWSLELGSQPEWRLAEAAKWHHSFLAKLRRHRGEYLYVLVQMMLKIKYDQSISVFLMFRQIPQSISPRSPLRNCSVKLLQKRKQRSNFQALEEWLDTSGHWHFESVCRWILSQTRGYGHHLVNVLFDCLIVQAVNIKYGEICRDWPHRFSGFGAQPYEIDLESRLKLKQFKHVQWLTSDAGGVGWNRGAPLDITNPSWNLSHSRLWFCVGRFCMRGGTRKKELGLHKIII